MKIGYVRVSTVEQNPGRQEELMKDVGVERLYIEHVSGKNSDRPELQAMLRFAKSGDEIHVESLSRLGRSLSDLVKITDELRGAGVAFVSHKENFDTTSASGRLIFHIFAALAEFERECMLERQREGIELAKREGKYRGRQPIDRQSASFVRAVELWRNRELTTAEAARLLGVSRTTFWKAAKYKDDGWMIE